MHLPLPPPDLVSELLQSAPELNPKMRKVCSELAGIKAALARINRHKMHSMEDMHKYQVGEDEGARELHGPRHK